jgi:hypothetical protein
MTQGLGAKLGISKNKVQKRGVFFHPEDMTVKTPRSPHKSPQNSARFYHHLHTGNAKNPCKTGVPPQTN